ncbi:PREDICTED: interferon alpha/beta receptor 2 [Chaetura pelagica]|uniref:interferon alpha/beta receptor 2 n=1 Tax=Chaetura pelagica TaxID=8897 RepID=UPI000523687C|nr:PREDICTED: interferon alpha/beta receptor 2 [Chaetura pelagica]
MKTLMDGPMHFYHLVYMSILSTAGCSLPETFLKGPPYNLQMKSHNFQHILSWQAKSAPAVPTYYRVLYTDLRNLRTAKQCSNITQLSCDLTDDFTDISQVYYTLVQSVIGTEVFNSSMLRFMPLTHTFLGPPEVTISSCLNCINVTIKLPASHSRKNGKLLSLIDIYKELDYDITLKTLDGEHKRSREKTTEANFHTVIEELYPNRNYCVSVMIAASLNKHSIPSVWKCVTLFSLSLADYHTAVIIGAVCFSLVLAGALKCVHAAGYILPKQSLPCSLVFGRTLGYSPWISEPEKISSVETIYKEMKKKTTESSGGVSDEDDSDASDSDAASNHDYTRRDTVSRVPPSSNVPNGFVPYSTTSIYDDTSSQASENPDSDPEGFEERGMDIEKDKDTSSELFNPFSEANCDYSPRRRNSACLTINLKTVLLGASEENLDSSAPLLSSQEDAADWKCTHGFEAKPLDDTGSVQKPLCHNGSHEWQNSSSDESDLSDSDTNPKTEYIRR